MINIGGMNVYAEISTGVSGVFHTKVYFGPFSSDNADSSRFLARVLESAMRESVGDMVTAEEVYAVPPGSRIYPPLEFSNFLLI